MTTKLGRLVTYDLGNLTTISHDSLRMGSREVTWQFKSSISLIP